MGAIGINKGRAAERDVINRLQPVVDYCYRKYGLEPPTLERRGLGLAGQDIEGLDWLALEVKHRNVLALDEWWRQAEQQAIGRNGQHKIPVLVYKKTGGKWRARLVAKLPQSNGVTFRDTLIDISFDDLEWWLHDKLDSCLHFETTARGR